MGTPHAWPDIFSKPGFMTRPLSIFTEPAAACRARSSRRGGYHLSGKLHFLCSQHIVDTRSRAEQELELQVQLVAALGQLHGQGHPLLAPIHRRVLTLSEQSEDAPIRFHALHGLWLYHLLHADLVGADQFAEQMIAEANVSQECAWLAPLCPGAQSLHVRLFCREQSTL